MMKETIILQNRLFEKGNATILECFVLEYYDGPKEMVNLTNNILFLWHDYTEDSELWFYFKVNDYRFLHRYLSNKIGIKDLSGISRIALCDRTYERYGIIEIFKWLADEEKDEYIPNNVFLGRDFLTEIKDRFDIHNTLKLFDSDKSSKVDTYAFSTKLEKNKSISLFKEICEFHFEEDRNSRFAQLEYIYPRVA